MSSPEVICIRNFIFGTPHTLSFESHVSIQIDKIIENMTTTFSNPSQLLPLGLCDILLLARHLGSHILFCGLQCTFLSYVFSLTGVNKLMHVYNYVMDNHKSENINILNIPTRYHSSIKCTKAYT